MDIGDILADLGPSSLIPPETNDLQALTRAWVTERCAPEILPWPESLMERVLDRVNAQVTILLSFFRGGRETPTVGRGERMALADVQGQ